LTLEVARLVAMLAALWVDDVSVDAVVGDDRAG
jgi:hypothetical protein